MSWTIYEQDLETLPMSRRLFRFEAFELSLVSKQNKKIQLSKLEKINKNKKSHAYKTEIQLVENFVDKLVISGRVVLAIFL